jgi:hypothetical protein
MSASRSRSSSLTADAGAEYFRHLDKLWSGEMFLLKSEGRAIHGH